MTIPAAAQPTPLTQPNSRLQFVDAKGYLTSPGALLLQKIVHYITSGNRVTPCSCSSASNVLTLTPNPDHPQIDRYLDHEFYPFVADSTSTGSVTATIVPDSGSLDTLKVFSGNSQAGAGDIVNGNLYILIYVDSLDSGAGGFALK